jgi:hypothetical protein
MSQDRRPLRLDPGAESGDPKLPAFLARPAGAPVYHGFPVVAETWTDGWTYGAITDFEDEDGAVAGDGYVISPQGRRAGLVWAVGPGVFSEVLPPTPDRWGVYAVWFPAPVRTVSDLITGFRAVLPDLRARYAELFPGEDA